jgi:regulator of PEP synthase PpsR (kinase-PPPase family)
MTTLSKYEDQWLGDKQIKFIETAEPSKSGVELVTVVFNDGSREQYAKMMLEQEGVATPQIQDLTEFRDKRVLPAVKDILKLLRDYNVRIDEVDYLMQKAFTSINMNLQEAETVFWGVKRLGQQTLVQVDDVLLGKKTTLNDVTPPVDKSDN